MVEFFIGLRHILSKSRYSLSLISLISVLGVFLGVTALVSVISVASGFEDAFRDKVLGVNSHILVMTYAQDDFREYRDVEKIIDASSDEIIESAPFIFHEMMVSMGSKIAGILIKGVDPNAMASVSDLTKYIIADSEEERLRIVESLRYVDENGDKRQPPPVIIGKVLAQKLKIGIGDNVRVISPKRGLPGESKFGPAQMAPTEKLFRVVGLYDSGFYDYDNRLMACDYKALQDFFNLNDVVTGVEIRVKNIDNTGNIRDNLLKILNNRPGMERFRIIDWQDLNRNLFTSLKLQKITLSIIMMFIVLVASFNILATLIMMVFEKQHVISILKSMGATDAMIMRTFIFQGLFIGAVGTGLGLLGGYGVCELVQAYDFGLNAEVYLINSLPVKMELSTFMGVGITALAICFFATLYPSWWATQLSPVEGLKYD